MNESLKLVSRTRDEVAATLAEMDDATRAQISADWMAKFNASGFQDPWVHGFHLILADGTNVGLGAFKGPPVDGVVEIAYAVLPEYQGRGHATTAARQMVEYALRSPQVSKVIAHTLPSGVASQRVLVKSGFTHTGEAIDPDDGLVWRFEITRD
jgi:RimJ/RimL family protein N-acetyltransferase